MSFMLALLDIPAVYFVMVLGLPVIVYYVGLLLYIGLQLLPATIIAYLLLRAMERAGLKI